MVFELNSCKFRSGSNPTFVVTLEGVDLQQLRQESVTSNVAMDDSLTDFSFSESRSDEQSRPEHDPRWTSDKTMTKTQPFQVDPFNINLSDRMFSRKRQTAVHVLKHNWWLCISDDDDDEENMAVDEAQPAKSERCRFWPNCKNGDECPYVHPAEPCTLVQY